MGDQDQSPQELRELLLRVLSISASLAGFCVAAIGLLNAHAKSALFAGLGDDLLAFAAVCFLICTYLSFWALRTRTEARLRALFESCRRHLSGWPDYRRPEWCRHRLQHCIARPNGSLISLAVLPRAARFTSSRVPGYCIQIYKCLSVTTSDVKTENPPANTLFELLNNASKSITYVYFVISPKAQIPAPRQYPRARLQANAT